MGSVKVTVYGRAKPCPKSLRSKEYRIKSSDNEDYITFTTTKPIPAKKSFRFRKIFNETATQEEVFAVVAEPVIENVLSGYNGTIFTYGQTGSGKTYTMTGDIEQWAYPGLIPRTIQRIFQLKDKDVTVSVTYCEIYNEHIYDLIRCDRPDTDITHVSLLEDSAGMTHFRNLSVHIVHSAYEAIQLLIRGDANKMVAETSSNAKSSRSHVLFSMTLEVPHPSQDKFYLKPVLYLVDLAGSEKLSKCKTQMANPWETRYINLSLHYLEQVLLALRQPGRVHIPYRNSLMTALLRNSLGGNCITAMIATFCLSVDDLDETIQTCRFAERIALIKNDVKITDAFSPERELDELRKENQKLKSQIKMLGGQLPNEELSEEEKEKCAAMVQGFIETSTVDSLPFTDIKRMEYCVCLMRDEIVRKLHNENNSGTTLEFFKNCPQSSSCNFEAQKNIAFNSFKSDKNWKQKKNSMTLPKVNITYKRWRSTEHLSEKKESVYKKMTTSSNQAGKKMIIMSNKITKAPSAEGYKNNKYHRQERKVMEKEPLQTMKLPHKLDGTSSYMAQRYHRGRRNFKAGRLKVGVENDDADEKIEYNSSEEEIELTVPEKESTIFRQSSISPNLEDNPSGSTFKIDKSDDEHESTGERFTFGKLKKLVSVDLQIDDGTAITKKEELAEDTQDLSITSGESTQFSWTYLPLTGDVEVDEEIVKFYKARYKIFNRQEN